MGVPLNPTPEDWRRHYHAERERLGRCPVSCEGGWIYACPALDSVVFPAGERCHPQDPACDRRSRCIFGCPDDGGFKAMAESLR